RCPRCGKTARQIREDGRFGCSQCYETFGKDMDLKSFVGAGYQGEALTGESAGKTEPEAPAESREEKLSRLREDLKKALAEEAYEKAATLRDQIRELEGK
ncbi:MAG: UvrB/UvrC motif-containing protein, partial [Clostridia bacterium]|nr:UvrB/UvrC motif-containing protein [Clostridia bacterium]